MINIKNKINRYKEQIKQLRLKISELEEEYKSMSDNTGVFNYEYNNKNVTGCCFPWCDNHNDEFTKVEFDNTKTKYDTHQFYCYGNVFKCEECYLYACDYCYDIDKLVCSTCLKVKKS